MVVRVKLLPLDKWTESIVVQLVRGLSYSHGLEDDATVKNHDMNHNMQWSQRIYNLSNVDEQELKQTYKDKDIQVW